MIRVLVAAVRNIKIAVINNILKNDSMFKQQLSPKNSHFWTNKNSYIPYGM